MPAKPYWPNGEFRVSPLLCLCYFLSRQYREATSLKISLSDTVVSSIRFSHADVTLDRKAFVVSGPLLYYENFDALSVYQVSLFNGSDLLGQASVKFDLVQFRRPSLTYPNFFFDLDLKTDSRVVSSVRAYQAWGCAQLEDVIHCSVCYQPLSSVGILASSAGEYAVAIVDSSRVVKAERNTPSMVQRNTIEPVTSVVAASISNDSVVNEPQVSQAPVSSGGTVIPGGSVVRRNTWPIIVNYSPDGKDNVVQVDLAQSNSTFTKDQLAEIWYLYYINQAIYACMFDDQWVFSTGRLAFSQQFITQNRAAVLRMGLFGLVRNQDQTVILDLNRTRQLLDGLESNSPFLGRIRSLLPLTQGDFRAIVDAGCYLLALSVLLVYKLGCQLSSASLFCILEQLHGQVVSWNVKRLAAGNPARSEKRPYHISRYTAGYEELVVSPTQKFSIIIPTLLIQKGMILHSATYRAVIIDFSIEKTTSVENEPLYIAEVQSSSTHFVAMQNVDGDPIVIYDGFGRSSRTIVSYRRVLPFQWRYCDYRITNSLGSLGMGTVKLGMEGHYLASSLRCNSFKDVIPPSSSQAVENPFVDPLLVRLTGDAKSAINASFVYDRGKVLLPMDQVIVAFEGQPVSATLAPFTDNRLFINWYKDNHIASSISAIRQASFYPYSAGWIGRLLADRRVNIDSSTDIIAHGDYLTCVDMFSAIFDPSRSTIFADLFTSYRTSDHLSLDADVSSLSSIPAVTGQAYYVETRETATPVTDVIVNNPEQAIQSLRDPYEGVKRAKGQGRWVYGDSSYDSPNNTSGVRGASSAFVF